MPLPFLPGHDASAVPAAGDLVVAATIDGWVAVRPDGALPTVATLPDLRVRHIGALHRRSVWAAELATIPDGLVSRSWLELTAEVPAPVAAVIARGYYQVRWRHTNRHCGECGGVLQDCPGFTTRRCPQCTTVPYVPNAMSPVVVVSVQHDGRLLLVRPAYGQYQHTWDLVAGFVEPGETLEAAAVRELWEETGLVPAQLAYASSHPWSFSGPSVLLASFTATVADPALRLDPAEIAEAQWFSRAELRSLPPAEWPEFAYTKSLIHRFVDA